MVGTVSPDEHKATDTVYANGEKMTLIPLHTKETAPEQSKPILERYEKNIGMIPNLFRLLAHSPDALKGVADLHAGLGRSLGARTRERIHIMTAEVNGCDYCLTTHTYLAGKFTKLTPEDMELNRKGHSTDPKTDAALQFAYKVAKSRGHIEAADFEAVRAAAMPMLRLSTSWQRLRSASQPICSTTHSRPISTPAFLYSIPTTTCWKGR